MSHQQFNCLPVLSAGKEIFEACDIKQCRFLRLYDGLQDW
jgi:hypothetical protein